MPGFFIAFEGIASAGKKTNIKLLADRLRNLGKEVVIISFPSYETDIGKLIKAWISRSLELDSETVSMLYAADRMQYQKRIKEWLKKGWIVITDRYCYSNIAYQSVLGLPKQWLIEIERPIIKPDLVILLDMPQKTPERERQESLQTFLDMKEEKPAITFRDKVRNTFLELADNPPYGEKWHVVDSSLPVEEVHVNIWSIMESLIS